MARFARMILLAGSVGILAASLAVANIPQADLSTVPSCMIVSPDGALDYTVEVIGSIGPVNGADVEILVYTDADALVSWCVGQNHPSILGNTDANGQYTFNIAAGGCVDAIRHGDVVYRVFADGVPIGEGSPQLPGAIVSPDAVNEAGLLPTDGDYVADTESAVTLADAVFHTGPIVTAVLEQCTDFNSDDVINVSDAVIVTPYIINATSCTL
jgi:hypothetical protein